MSNRMLRLHKQLIEAIRRSDECDIHDIISKGALTLSPAKNKPLIVASIIGNVNIVRTLLEYKLNVNVTDGNMDTPLIWASYMGNTATVRYLVDAKADVEHVGFQNLCPMEVALERKNHDVIEILQTMHYEPMLRGFRNVLKRLLFCDGIRRIILAYCTPRWC